MLSIKQTFLMLAAFLMPVSFFAQNNNDGKSVLRDPSLSKGLAVESITDPASLSGNLLVDTTAKPEWHLCQPNSRFDAAKCTMETRGDNTIFNVAGNGNLLAKVVRVNPVRNVLYLECNASAEYTGIRRDGQPWVGLWASQSLDSLRVASCRQLALHMEYRVTFYEDCMGFLADKDVHSAVCCASLILKNDNKGSDAYGKRLKVVVPMFDNRNVGLPYNGGVDKEGDMVVFRPASEKCLSSGRIPKVKQKEFVNVVLLPVVTQAVKAAAMNGYMPGAVPDDFLIEGFTVGWEMKGTFNSAVEIKNLKLIYL
ncbi:MAG: hypothetical protein KBT44_02540 [Bacteroidales bacterium]|nr:hypothetical protein [Candidatus Equibacterium intestinale]